MAGHFAARSHRPRAGGRLQPQGFECLQRQGRPAGRCQGCHRARRRHHLRPARVTECRRRRQYQPAQRADRGRHPQSLHPGRDERALDGRGPHRQWSARELCARADATHDKHLHACRRQGAPGNRGEHQTRPVRHQLWGWPGRHHLWQVRLLGQRGLLGRKRQGAVPGQGRDHRRQRSGRTDPGHDDRQRHET